MIIIPILAIKPGDKLLNHLSDMVGEYVWVKKDVVVIGDACSLLPSIGRARRTWSDLLQVKLYHRSQRE